MQRTFYSLVAAGAAMIGCCYGFARFAYGLFVPVFTDEFQLGPTAIGVIGAGSYVGYCAATVAALLLTDRLGARRIAVAAGLLATVGIAVVAVAPSASVLAAGLLVAGASTGLASPPLATAIAHRLSGGAADRAQTIVNAGTGIGVVVSAPIALVLFGQWRIAWGVYAVITAMVTAWIAATLHRDAPTGGRRAGFGHGYRRGTTGLLAASFSTGLGSIAVWNFGRSVIGSGSAGGDGVATAAWTVLGAAGVAGALGGGAVRRFGLRRAWASGVLAMSAATVLLPVAASHGAVVILATGAFGAAYIAVTGLLLLWSTRVYPEAAAFGVGLSFFAIAAGQALGAPAAGALIDAVGATAAFVVIAALGAAAVALRPPVTTSAPTPTFADPTPPGAASHRDA